MAVDKAWEQEFYEKWIEVFERKINAIKALVKSRALTTAREYLEDEKNAANQLYREIQQMHHADHAEYITYARVALDSIVRQLDKLEADINRFDVKFDDTEKRARHMQDILRRMLNYAVHGHDTTFLNDLVDSNEANIVVNEINEKLNLFTAYKLSVNVVHHINSGGDPKLVKEEVDKLEAYLAGLELALKRIIRDNAEEISPEVMKGPRYKIAKIMLALAAQDIRESERLEKELLEIEEEEKIIEKEAAAVGKEALARIPPQRIEVEMARDSVREINRVHLKKHLDVLTKQLKYSSSLYVKYEQLIPFILELEHKEIDGITFAMLLSACNDLAFAVNNDRKINPKEVDIVMISESFFRGFLVMIGRKMKEYPQNTNEHRVLRIIAHSLRGEEKEAAIIEAELKRMIKK